MDIEQCYKILEIEPQATPEVVKQTYKDLVYIWHPDRFPNKPRLRKKAEERLKSINIAYEFLSDPQRKVEQKTHPYPENKRKFTRKPCSLWVRHATDWRNSSAIYDSIEDISAEGVFIQTQEHLFVGQRVQLEFSLPRFGQLKNITGEVVWSCSEGCGVKFKITDKFKKLIDTFVDLI